MLSTDMVDSAPLVYGTLMGKVRGGGWGGQWRECGGESGCGKDAGV